MQGGNLFIISAPSGTGKTTILKKIVAAMDNVAFSVSHTTRAPRPVEQNGIDYFFIDKDNFVRMQQQGLFLEWAEVHGNLYGTSSYAIQTATEQGRDLLLDIDVQGARQRRKKPSWRRRSRGGFSGSCGLRRRSRCLARAICRRSMDRRGRRSCLFE